MDRAAPESPRYHDLDALRSAMMLLGVFFHGAISFMEMPIPWFVKDRSTHAAVDFACWISHEFRMPVFFLMSGFFARLLCERYGLRGFVRHRLKRILVPFVVALPLLLACFYYLWAWGQSTRPVPPLLGRFKPPDLEPRLRNISPAHLWFLYYLLMLAVGTVLAVRSGLRAGPRTDRVFRILASSPFLVALPTAAVLQFMPSIEVDTPMTFVPHLPILAFYSILFAFGWFLHRQPDLVDRHRRRGGLWLVLAVLLVPALAFFLLQADPDGRVRSTPWRPAALYASALFTWTAAFLLLGLFSRLFSKPRNWVRWLSDSSYWVYILHLPVVVAFQIACANLAWPGAVKYLFLVMAPTLAVCLLSYRYLVRYTFIGTALNGPRVRE